MMLMIFCTNEKDCIYIIYILNQMTVDQMVNRKGLDARVNMYLQFIFRYGKGAL